MLDSDTYYSSLLGHQIGLLSCCSRLHAVPTVLPSQVHVALEPPTQNHLPAAPHLPCYPPHLPYSSPAQYTNFSACINQLPERLVTRSYETWKNRALYPTPEPIPMASVGERTHTHAHALY